MSEEDRLAHLAAYLKATATDDSNAAMVKLIRQLLKDMDEINRRLS